MSLRDQIREAARRGDVDEIVTIVAGSSRAFRYVVGMTYRPEESVRELAGRAVARIAAHHPKLVQEAVRRLVWAMNDESGTHALTAPAVLLCIAQEQPSLLLPVVPDLIRLSADEGLRMGLSEVLQTLRRKCPGEVAARLATDLRDRGA